MTSILLPFFTLVSRCEMINERPELAGKYSVEVDASEGTLDVFDTEGEYLFTLPQWVNEDVETAVMVTLAMGEAYAAGWTDRDNQGVGA